jgi:hypothetical protein
MVVVQLILNPQAIFEESGKRLAKIGHDKGKNKAIYQGLITEVVQRIVSV